MFTLAIPVSAAGIHLLDSNIAVLRHLGGLERHRAIFFPTKEVSGQIAGAVDGLKTVMNAVGVHPLKDTPTGGWPAAPNKHFAAVVQVMVGVGTPWLWWEEDCTATKQGWLDALETEYNLRKRPFLGMNVPTRYTEGSPAAFGDDHMVGCGVYPADFGRGGNLPYGHLWKTLPHIPDVPFDIYQSGEIRKNLHNSELMQHMWGTVDFRKNAAGDIICSPKPGNPEGSDHSGTVHAKAAVVHGCKDGSLARLILSETNVPRAEFKKEEQHQNGGPLTVSTPQGTIYQPKRILADTNYKMSDSWDAMAEEPTMPDEPTSDPNGEQGEPATGESVAPTDGGTSPPAPPHETKGTEDSEPSMVDKVVSLLAKKNLKVKDVATILQIPDQKEFEKFLLENGFTFSGMAKWLKAPQLQTT